MRELPALTRERMESWLAARAAELGIRLGPGAAQSLAQRVGAYVREGDVDRRRQSELANGELEKLALYRPDGEVSRCGRRGAGAGGDPGIHLGIPRRDRREAGGGGRASASGCSSGGTPLPVIVSPDPSSAARPDHWCGSTWTPAHERRSWSSDELQPFRAQKLSEQAATWTAGALVGRSVAWWSWTCAARASA